MKKKSVLGLGLATVIGAMGAIGSSGCGDSSSSGGAPAATAGTTGHAGASGAVNGTAGGAGSPTTAGAANGGSSGLAETAGSAGACTDVPSLVIFTRSDTDASWDDNDFDAVTLSGMCPTLVNVTWPHEAGWQNADPAEANHESTHFTLDSGTSADLTGKKLELTIELTGDTRGPTATAGSYIVSLVSVSTWDQVVGGDTGGAGGMSGGGGASTGGASGSAGSGGSAGSVAGTGGTAGAAAGAGGAAAGTAGTSGASTAGADTGGTSGGGADGTAGAAPTTQTAYTEAESPVALRATLHAIGDKATVSFPLPAKSTMVGSYDPTRVIKINVRIYSAFSDGTTGAGGAGGGGGAAGTAGSSGSAGSAGAVASAGNGGSNAGAAGSGTAGSSAGAGGATIAPVYDYLTSQFTISKFVIVDASAP